MRQQVHAGGFLDILTPSELHDALHTNTHQVESLSRVRVAESVVLDAAGNGIVVVYKVPTGARFAVRRVQLELSTSADPYTGNVVFAAGHYVKYLRNDSLISYAIPQAPNLQSQVPGTEEWSEQEGPYLTGSEQFAVQAVGLTANAGFIVKMQGVLYGPEMREPNGRPR